MNALSRRACLALLATAGASARADLPALIAGAKPSVLPIGTVNPTDNPRFTFRGTGFVVGDGNHVVTAAHVLPPPDDPAALARLTALLPSQRESRALKLVAADRVHDVALLRFDGSALAALPLAAPDGVREGQAVALIGFPLGGALGFAPVTHRGIVASLTSSSLPAPSSRQLEPGAVARLREGSFQLLQLDAVAYPGNSGGPLLDAASGQVIGVMNMVAIKSSRESAISVPTGISYAVPVRYVRELMGR
jgi:serine protease Do